MEKTRIVIIRGVSFVCSEQGYKELERERQRYKYIRNLDKKYRLQFYSELDCEAGTGQELLADEAVDTEQQAMINIQIEQLWIALQQLNDEEMGLIEGLFFQELSERELSRLCNLPQSTIHYRKQAVLKKLKKLMGDL